MLHFSDEPYQFFAPRPNRLVMACAGLANRLFVLPRQHLIERLELHCPDSVYHGRREGKRILFVPNHSTHSDPQTMFEAQRRWGIRSFFMAAYDAFYISRFRGWLLSRTGVFSVDRETSDKKSLNQAIQTLVDGRYVLTIFPEGNVYLQNDLPTPFHEGAFYIAWKALQILEKENRATDILICPVSMRFTHMTDCRPQLRAMLHQAAVAGGTQFDEGKPHVEELRRIGGECLKKAMRQWGVRLEADSNVPLPKLIQNAADAMMQSLEGKIGLESKPDDTSFDRIRRIRREIHRIRIDPKREPDHEVASSWANEAMTALRVVSYTGQYLDHPTLDRFGETTEKLIEDIYSKMGKAYAKRCAYVHVQKPISLSEFLKESKGRSKDALRDLARLCEVRVKEGIDAINADNPHLGGQFYESMD